jgi:trans-aconitate methyltransferase
MIERKTPQQKVHWEAGAYDQSMGFVSHFGEDLMGWLNPQADEKIVDFGCGTGDLAARIHNSGAEVMGVDISPEMIERARSKYPHLNFQCSDGMEWRAEPVYDAVFSNAALHWMKDPEAAIASMKGCLRSAGRLVAEFGGYRNVQGIINAVKETLTEARREEAFFMPWYFPTVGEYASLLEKAGFEVASAALFDRSTKLEGEEDGMIQWLEMFGTAMFPSATEDEANEWIRAANDKLRATHYRDGVWTADYRRIRIHAVKNK